MAGALMKQNLLNFSHVEPLTAVCAIGIVIAFADRRPADRCIFNAVAQPPLDLHSIAIALGAGSSLVFSAQRLRRDPRAAKTSSLLLREGKHA
jgi:hypothetical protein